MSHCRCEVEISKTSFVPDVTESRVPSICQDHRGSRELRTKKGKSKRPEQGAHQRARRRAINALGPIQTTASNVSSSMSREPHVVLPETSQPLQLRPLTLSERRFYNFTIPELIIPPIKEITHLRGNRHHRRRHPLYPGGQFTRKIHGNSDRLSSPRKTSIIVFIVFIIVFNKEKKFFFNLRAISPFLFTLLPSQTEKITYSRELATLIAYFCNYEQK